MQAVVAARGARRRCARGRQARRSGGVRVAYADRVPPGTTIGGLDLGGRSPQDIARALCSTSAHNRTLTLTVATRRFVLGARRLGYRCDAAAAAARARRAGRGVRSTACGRRSRAWCGRGGSNRSRASIAACCPSGSPRSPARWIATPGPVRSSPPRGHGRACAPRAARSRAHLPGRPRRRGSVPRRSTGVRTPSRLRGRRSRRRRRSRCARSRAARARTCAHPLRLKAASRTRALSKRRIAGIPALESVARGARGLRLGVDRSARAVRRLARRRPRPRRRHRRRREPVGAPAAARGGGAAIADAVRTGSRTVTLAFTRPHARLTTAAARNVTSLLGGLTTRYACCQPRVTNIRLLAEKVDGTVVLPVNGSHSTRPAASARAPPAMSRRRSSPTARSSTRSAAASRSSPRRSTAPRTSQACRSIRHRLHSFYIGRDPPGREATLRFPAIDMAWTNDTTAPVLIRAATDGTSVVASIYGTDHGRRVRAQTGERRPVSGGAFQITVTRVIRYRDEASERQPSPPATTSRRHRNSRRTAGSEAVLSADHRDAAASAARGEQL